MPYLIGTTLGGLLAIFILSRIWEWALFMRVMDEPTSGKLLSVVAAWVTAGIIGGFGMADGTGFTPLAFGIYLLPAFIVGFFAYRAGVRISQEQENPDGYRP